MTPFHYAFKIKNIEIARQFYIDLLGCKEGRSTDTWIDFDFFGHQLSAHLSQEFPTLDYCGLVDGIKVPIPHFGCILPFEEFIKIQNKLEHANIQFIVPPYIRYEGLVGEQHTMFFLDPSVNPIEFKAYTNHEELFSS